MAATHQEVQNWIKNGKKIGATHLISVCDTFDWEDYPVYVKPDENLEEIKKEYDNNNMQKINEVICLIDESSGTVEEEKQG